MHEDDMAYEMAMEQACQDHERRLQETNGTGCYGDCPELAALRTQLAGIAMQVLGFDGRGDAIPYDDAKVTEAIERLCDQLAEAKKYGAQVDVTVRRSSLPPKTCQHNDYWTTNYGNCMACRAERAESQLAESKRKRGLLVSKARNLLTEVVACHGPDFEGWEFPSLARAATDAVLAMEEQ